MRTKSRYLPADPEAFARALHARGLKVTPRRLAVHRAMIGFIHATPEQVWEKVKEENACRITRGTVYTMLSELAEKGIYARRFGSAGKIVYDVNPFRHVHIYDSRNHQFVDVDEEALLQAVEEGLKRRRFKGYRIDDIDLQIICHPTRKKLL